jgi:hypothetical protein
MLFGTGSPVPKSLIGLQSRAWMTARDRALTRSRVRTRNLAGNHLQAKWLGGSEDAASGVSPMSVRSLLARTAVFFASVTALTALMTLPYLIIPS